MRDVIYVLLRNWELRLASLNEAVALGSYKSRHARNELQLCINEVRASLADTQPTLAACARGYRSTTAQADN